MKIDKFVQKALSKSKVDKFMERVLALSATPVLLADDVEKNETPVEIISIDEIYLLGYNGDGNAKRLRRICGAPRLLDKNLRCLMPPGRGTIHLGTGRCWVHESRLIHSPVDQLRMYAKQGFALSIAESIELYPKLLEDEKLGEIKEEIIILECMLHSMLNLPESFPVYAKEIMEIIESLRSVKVSKSKIETDKLLIDVRALKLFVQSILAVAKEILGGPKSDLYQRFLLALDSKVFFPANKAAQGLIEIRKVDDE